MMTMSPVFKLLAVAAFVAANQSPACARSESGAWSKCVDGVQGRLIASEGEMCNGTRMILLYLELRNASDAGNPLKIYYGGNNSGVVLDKRGRKIPRPGFFASIMDPPPYWLVLPHDSTLRFRISATGYAVPKNAGAMLNMWHVKPDQNAPYYYKGQFKASPRKSIDARNPWQGTLDLPKVKIPLPSSSAG